MINPDDRQHLTYIVDSIDEIEGYMQYEDYNDFSKDEFAKEAVARICQDIGGAAKLLSDEFKETHGGSFDWDVLIRLEDAMYDQATETNFEALYGVLKNDLPIIKDGVSDIAAKFNDEEDIQGFDLTENPNTF